jgi:hypothetical protein
MNRDLIAAVEKEARQHLFDAVIEAARQRGYTFTMTEEDGAEVVRMYRDDGSLAITARKTVAGVVDVTRTPRPS